MYSTTVPYRCWKAAGICWRVSTSGAPVTTTLPSDLAAASISSQVAGTLAGLVTGVSCAARSPAVWTAGELATGLAAGDEPEGLVGWLLEAGLLAPALQASRTPPAKSNPAAALPS